MVTNVVNKIEDLVSSPAFYSLDYPAFARVAKECVVKGKPSETLVRVAMRWILAEGLHPQVQSQRLGLTEEIASIVGINFLNNGLNTTNNSNGNNVNGNNNNPGSNNPAHGMNLNNGPAVAPAGGGAPAGEASVEIAPGSGGGAGSDGGGFVAKLPSEPSLPTAAAAMTSSNSQATFPPAPAMISSNQQATTVGSPSALGSGSFTFPSAAASSLPAAAASSSFAAVANYGLMRSEAGGTGVGGGSGEGGTGGLGVGGGAGSGLSYLQAQVAQQGLPYGLNSPSLSFQISQLGGGGNLHQQLNISLQQKQQQQQNLSYIAQQMQGVPYGGLPSTIGGLGSGGLGIPSFDFPSTMQSNRGPPCNQASTQ